MFYSLRLTRVLVLSALLLAALPIRAMADPVGIVSDIDDTVRVMGVKHGFPGLFKKDAFAGMAELYSELLIATQGTPEHDLYFVSAGPTLFTPLTQVKPFLTKNGFSTNNVILRNLIEGESALEHKTSTFAELMKAHPSQHFLFIGDDTEFDVNAIENAYKAGNASVSAMYIHQVDGVNPAHAIEATQEFPESVQIPYFTAVEIGLRELKRGEIKITTDQIAKVAAATLRAMPFEAKVAPKWAKICPRDAWLTNLVNDELKLTLPQELKGQLDLLQARVNAVCLTHPIK